MISKWIFDEKNEVPRLQIHPKSTKIEARSALKTILEARRSPKTRYVYYQFSTFWRHLADFGAI